MEKKEKFLLLGLLLVLILVVVVSLFIGGNKDTKSKKLSNDSEVVYKNAQQESEAVKESEKKDFIQIDVNKFIEYLNGESSMIVLVARPTCGYCQIAEPIIQNVAYEYDLNINYLNTDNFSEEDSDKFLNSNEMFKDDFGTPTLMIVSNNSIIDSVGLTDYAHYVDFFTRNSFIKE